MSDTALSIVPTTTNMTTATVSTTTVASPSTTAVSASSTVPATWLSRKVSTEDTLNCGNIQESEDAAADTALVVVDTLQNLCAPQAMSCAALSVLRRPPYVERPGASRCEEWECFEMGPDGCIKKDPVHKYPQLDTPLTPFRFCIITAGVPGSGKSDMAEHLQRYARTINRCAAGGRALTLNPWIQLGFDMEMAQNIVYQQQLNILERPIRDKINKMLENSSKGDPGALMNKFAQQIVDEINAHSPDTKGGEGFAKLMVEESELYHKLRYQPLGQEQLDAAIKISYKAGFRFRRVSQRSKARLAQAMVQNMDVKVTSPGGNVTSASRSSRNVAEHLFRLLKRDLVTYISQFAKTKTIDIKLACIQFLTGERVDSNEEALNIKFHNSSHVIAFFAGYLCPGSRGCTPFLTSGIILSLKALIALFYNLNIVYETTYKSTDTQEWLCRQSIIQTRNCKNATYIFLLGFPIVSVPSLQTRVALRYINSLFRKAMFGLAKTFVYVNMGLPNISVSHLRKTLRQVYANILSLIVNCTGHNKGDCKGVGIDFLSVFDNETSYKKFPKQFFDRIPISARSYKIVPSKYMGRKRGLYESHKTVIERILRDSFEKCEGKEQELHKYLSEKSGHVSKTTKREEEMRKTVAPLGACEWGEEILDESSKAKMEEAVKAFKDLQKKEVLKADKKSKVRRASRASARTRSRSSSFEGDRHKSPTALLEKLEILSRGAPSPPSPPTRAAAFRPRYYRRSQKRFRDSFKGTRGGRRRTRRRRRKKRCMTLRH